MYFSFMIIIMNSLFNEINKKLLIVVVTHDDWPMFSVSFICCYIYIFSSSVFQSFCHRLHKHIHIPITILIS